MRLASAEAVVEGNPEWMLPPFFGTAARMRRACPARAASGAEPRPSTSTTAALRARGSRSSGSPPDSEADAPASTCRSDGVCACLAGSMGAIL